MSRAPPPPLDEREVARLIALLDPPAGVLPPADEVAALLEGRLLPAEEEALRARIDVSAAARAELRSLAPAIFARLFPDDRPHAQWHPRAWRPAAQVAAVGAAVALGAATAWLFLPPVAPDGASLHITTVQPERGGPGPLTVAPHQPVDLLVQMGRLRPLDRLRGIEAWVILFLVHPEGDLERVCSSMHADCIMGDRTLATRWPAPTSPGDYTLLLLSGAGDPALALATEAMGLRGLETIAPQAPWSIDRVPLRVKPR